MSKRPLVGISLSDQTPDSAHPELPRYYEISVEYPRAVEMAGGIPLLLPHTHDESLRSEIIERLDALIIPGGEDLNPKLYGQARHQSTRLVDPLRQDFDFAMLALAERKNIPTLGICLGSQIMNVQRGGTLHQHLPDVLKAGDIRHASDPSVDTDRNAWHDVTLAPGSRIKDIYAVGHLKVNSRHHQGIDRLGNGLVIAARSPDGVIEAIEDPTLNFWIGTAWHAEGLVDDAVQIKLFQALVHAAEKRA
ncbi:MAG TPA: gamma-glutamyl-gamma-aminobutyrate hydrolase family protein [Phycisphaerae bacterium]|nr:gamma-glutamyl-gamma-aminobutyrate hydrolase family protein [Phycisphaerae bacterium]